MEEVTSKFKSFNKWLAYLSLLIIGLIVGLMLYWLYSAPADVITLKTLPIAVETSNTVPNGFVVLKYTYCKSVNKTGRVSTSLVSSNSVLMLPTGNDATDKGCRDVRAAIPIPPQAVKGTYHFHFRAAYRLNPLVSRTQEFDTANFEVK